jgi:MOSC domain-containing protein YiiM
MAGSVQSIHIAAEAEGRTHAVAEVRAVAGRGLEGDRYFAGDGTYFEEGKRGQDITLIEAEALAGLARDDGIELGPGETRRNVVTGGISLNELVGRRFTIGAVECVGQRLCDPCRHLQRLTKPGVLRGLANRGGLRADVLAGGRIAVGDEVRDLGAAVS